MVLVQNLLSVENERGFVSNFFAGAIVDDVFENPALFKTYLYHDG